MSGSGVADFVLAFGSKKDSDQLLQDLLGDARRISSRLDDIKKAGDVLSSYFTDAVKKGIQEVTDEHAQLMAQWTNPLPADLGNRQKIAAHTERMSKAFDKINDIYNKWNPTQLQAIMRREVAALNLLVRPGPAWDQLFSLPALTKVKKADLPAFVANFIVDWKSPKLSVWMREGQITAASGKLRVIALSPFEGVKTHMSIYIANIDPNGSRSIDDAIEDIVDTLLPAAAPGGTLGTHVTWELFGQDDRNNPRYFKGSDFFINGGASKLAEYGTDQAKLSANLEKQLQDQTTAIRNLLQKFIATRKAAVV